MSSLREIWVNLNRITGHLPAEWSRMEKVNVFSIGKNDISGTIPAGYSNWRTLQYAFLNENHLSGSIPVLSRMRNLKQFRADSNDLSGSIPKLPQKIQNLWLSGNKLSGQLPMLPQSLIYILLEKNQLQGTVPTLPSSIFRGFGSEDLTDIYQNPQEHPGVLFLYNNRLSCQLPGTNYSGVINSSRFREFVALGNYFNAATPRWMDQFSGVPRLFNQGLTLASTPVLCIIYVSVGALCFAICMTCAWSQSKNERRWSLAWLGLLYSYIDYDFLKIHYVCLKLQVTLEHV